MSQIIVRDDHGVGIPYICLRISEGNKPQEAAIYDVLVKPDGSTGWPIPGWNPMKRCTVYVNVGDYTRPQWSDTKIVMPDDGDANGDAVVTLTPTGQAPTGESLEALVGIDSAAHRFVTESGRRQFLRGVTSFLLYKRFLDGEDLRPLLSQLQGIGANTVRIFGMVTSFAHWHPQDYFDKGYYERMPEFLDHVGGFGQTVLWTACADTQQIMPNGWLEHMRQTLKQLRQRKNKVFSFVNEQGQHENGIDRQLAYDHLRAEGLLDGLMFDTGSFGEDAKCLPPLGTYAPFHVRRAYPSHVKDCCVLDHPNYVSDHLQVLLDEPDRYGEGGNMNLEQARDSAATSFCALGFVLHTSQGVQSQPFSGRTLEIAQTVFPILKGF